MYKRINSKKKCICQILETINDIQKDNVYEEVVCRREEDSDTKDAMIEEAVWVDDWWGCRHNRHAHTVV
jgi:hypothetical protein